MFIDLYQVDAFTNRLFAGNPAGVCKLDEWLRDDIMQSIAIENNLSETAFFISQGDGFHLRWFTPKVEVDLCGHATLASAYVLFNELGFEGESIRFATRSGDLFVSREGDLLTLDFPTKTPLPVTCQMGFPKHWALMRLRFRPTRTMWFYLSLRRRCLMQHPTLNYYLILTRGER